MVDVNIVTETGSESLNTNGNRDTQYIQSHNMQKKIFANNSS